MGTRSLNVSERYLLKPVFILGESNIYFVVKRMFSGEDSSSPTVIIHTVKGKADCRRDSSRPKWAALMVTHVYYWYQRVSVWVRLLLRAFA